MVVNNTHCKHITIFIETLWLLPEPQFNVRTIFGDVSRCWPKN